MTFFNYWLCKHTVKATVDGLVFFWEDGRKRYF